MNKSNQYRKSKKQIHLSESILSDMIANATKKILRESSYDAQGNFDSDSHNMGLKKRLDDEISDIHTMINKKILRLNYIGSNSTDNKIKRQARIVINELLNLAKVMSDSEDDSDELY